MNFRANLLFLFAGAAAAQTAPDLREAARLDQSGRCQESEAIYQRALAQGAPGPALLNNTGNHYLACGQPEKARIYFERLLKAVPRHLNATIQIATLDLASGNFASAEARLDKLAPASSGSFEVLFLLGRAAGRAGHAAKAREALEAALRLRPDDPAAMLEAGLADAASGDYARAVFLLARARSKSPDHPGIALALARASEDAGYYGDAALAYDQYLSLSPRDDAARRDQARVRALTAAGRRQGLRDLRAYIASHARDPLGHFYLAQLVWRDEPEAALEALSEAARLDPKFAPALVARAWLLQRSGRTEEALEAVEAALRLSPTDIRALDQKGVTLLALDRTSEAEAALRKAAALAPNDPDVALHLGRALVDQGREEEGQRYLDAYQKLRPARQRHPRETGMIELATLDPAGRRAREIDRFRSMAKSRLDDPLLQLHLAGLLLADGQHEEALRQYQALASLNGDSAIWAQAGRALLDAGHFREACLFLERAADSLALAEAKLRSGGDPPANVDELVAQARQFGTPPAQAARSAGLLLAAQGRFDSAREAIAAGLRADPNDRQLLLAEAVVAALHGNLSEAETKLRSLQARWPDGDPPRIARRLLRPPKNSSSTNPGSCATLREWVFGTCGR